MDMKAQGSRSGKALGIGELLASAGSATVNFQVLAIRGVGKRSCTCILVSNPNTMCASCQLHPATSPRQGLVPVEECSSQFC